MIDKHLKRIRLFGYIVEIVSMIIMFCGCGIIIYLTITKYEEFALIEIVLLVIIGFMISLIVYFLGRLINSIMYGYSIIIENNLEEKIKRNKKVVRIRKKDDIIITEKK